MGAMGRRGGRRIAPTGRNGVEYWMKATAPRLGRDFALPPAVYPIYNVGGLFEINGT